MPYTITSIETTPNPAARKLIVSPAPGSIRSFFNANSAQGDELGRAIFAVEGVTNVLIHTRFISVVAAPGTNWNSLAKKLEAALGSVDAH